MVAGMIDRPSAGAFLKRFRKERSVQPAPTERVSQLRQRVGALSKEVRKLNKRVDELDAELLDARSQGRRIGEISDLVTELLANEASRRDPEFQRIVAKYVDE